MNRFGVSTDGDQDSWAELPENLFIEVWFVVKRAAMGCPTSFFVFGVPNSCRPEHTIFRQSYCNRWFVR